MTTVIKMTTFSVEIHDYCTIDDRDDKTHEEDVIMIMTMLVASMMSSTVTMLMTTNSYDNACSLYISL